MEKDLLNATWEKFEIVSPAIRTPGFIFTYGRGRFKWPKKPFIRLVVNNGGVTPLEGKKRIIMGDSI